jgi:hypothetical protein
LLQEPLYAALEETRFPTLDTDTAIARATHLENLQLTLPGDSRSVASRNVAMRAE